MLAGLVVGILLGLALMWIKPPEYEGVAKVLVNRNYPDKSSTYGYLTDAQLIQTFQYLIKTESILNETAQTLDLPVNPDKVTVENVIDTMILKVSYIDRDPEVAANVANTLVSVLIKQNQDIQQNNYAQQETSLKNQITVVEQQIADLQQQYGTRQNEVIANQISQVDLQIADYSNRIMTLQKEIAALGTPLDPGARSQLAEKQAQLDEYQPLLTLYQQIRTNLEYLGRPYQAGSGLEDQVLNNLSTLIKQYQDVYSSLISQLEDTQLASAKNSSMLLQIETAIPPDKPGSSMLLANPAIMGLVWLVLALFAALILQMLDTTIRTSEQVRIKLGLRTLAKLSPTVISFDLHNPKTWSFQNETDTGKNFLTLRTSLELIRKDYHFGSLLISSFLPQEGKSTLAVNLAINYASGGLRAILVDANFEHFSTGNFSYFADSAGLTDILFADTAFESNLLKNTGAHGLRVLALGKTIPDPMKLAESGQVEGLVTKLCRNRDIVIFDGANLSEENTRILASFVDAILIVLRPGSMTVESSVEILQNLHVKPEKIVGVVMNEYAESEKGHESLASRVNHGLQMRRKEWTKTKSEIEKPEKMVKEQSKVEEPAVVVEPKQKRITGW